MPWDYVKKDSDMYFESGTREISKQLASELSTWNEGSDDILEISPNSIDHVLDWTLGGAKTLVSSADMLGATIEEGYGNGFDVNQLLVARRFLKSLENQEWRYSTKYYEIYNKGLSERLTEEDVENLHKLADELKEKGRMTAIDNVKHLKKIYKVQTTHFPGAPNVFLKND